MIYHDKQIVHVHPPKTGGQAIQQALGLDPTIAWNDGVWRHDSLETMWYKHPVSREYLTAISVRDPRERLVSFYYYVIYARTLDGDPTREYMTEYNDIVDFLCYADFDALQEIDAGEAVLRTQCSYLDGHKPDVVWRLEEVGPLLPVVNKVFDHFSWEDVSDNAERLNKTLRWFLKQDMDCFYKERK